ncbi:hypothetical protein RJ639_041981 [Escallonia herrerae]|uniref:Retroviral polymerase SH3-like domain-containing protein n=1 Tax=Escallonia herrerae TaxID=1293975 RepID=A0AA88WIK3_9ASTE|nr:hypothetical protein RJ639_041981 [Escallonia herrerae]
MIHTWNVDELLSFVACNWEFHNGALSADLTMKLWLPKPTKNGEKGEEISLPPGRTGWPVIGESLDYLSKIQSGTLENFVTDRMNKYSSKVFKTSLIGQPMAILCGPEGNKFLFSNEKKIVQVWFPGWSNKIFPKSHDVSNNEDFVNIRRMLPLFLKADSLQKYVGIMDLVMKQHLQTNWDGDHVEVCLVVRKYTLALACRLFLSIDDPREVEKLAKPIEDIVAGIFSGFPINLPGTALNRAIKASKEIRVSLDSIVKQRKVDLTEKIVFPVQDILSHMLLTVDENGQFLNTVDISSHLLGLIFSGYSTLNGTLTFVMKYLAELPHVYDEVLRGKLYEHHFPCKSSKLRGDEWDYRLWDYEHNKIIRSRDVIFNESRLYKHRLQEHGIEKENKEYMELDEPKNRQVLKIENPEVLDEISHTEIRAGDQQ